MRLGVITDIHLCSMPHAHDRFHNVYVQDRAMLYAAALQRCVLEEVDAIVILGDVAHDGDDESLRNGVRFAAATQRTVWMVPGNHDSSIRPDGLEAAIAQSGAANVSMPPLRGMRLDDGTQVVGIVAVSEDAGHTAFAPHLPHVVEWGAAPVLLLSHYPVVSVAALVASVGLAYAGDLRNHTVVAELLLARSGPTIVLHGHLHLRHEYTDDSVLQFACAALVEPPHEITILDIGEGNAELYVRRKNIAIMESPTVRLPVLSAEQTIWVFRDRRWMLNSSTDTQGDGE